ncbi:MAG: S4 domain-containing protein [Thioalkalispiraceae bacterium]|jgi:ribosome-associated heat shock protein Hsp15
MSSDHNNARLAGIHSANVRLDKWLWAARFYKTRSMASDAVNGGHVHVNGQRCKSSRSVQIGDQIRITKGSLVFTIIVKNLSEKRGTARQAAELYTETQESIEKRELTRLQRKAHNMANPHPVRKPDKRQRRQLKAWQGKT